MPSDLHSGCLSNPKTIATPELLKYYINEVIFRLRSGNYQEKYPRWPGMVGLELEMLATNPAKPFFKTGAPAPIPLQGSSGSVVSTLKELARKRSWTFQDQKGDNNQHMTFRFDMSQQDALTFEPGGQVEFSSRPYPCLQDAVRRLRSIQKLLDQAFSATGWRLTQIGISPWHTPEELGLQMPKPRYRAMDHYFSMNGPWGQRMMRQTCTIQTCLDFGPDETTMAKRYLAAQLLAPFQTAIFAYSPFADRSLTGMPGFRAKIWRKLDPGRTGLTRLGKIAAQLDKAACVDSYLEFALNARTVFAESAGFKVPHGPLTFAEWMSRSPKSESLPAPTVQDMENHLSLLFPEVRPRGFLELRSADCQARPWQIVPAAFSTGLLYNERSLDQALDRLLPLKDNIEFFQQRAERGLQDPSLARQAKELITLSHEGFKKLPPCFRGEGSEKALEVFASLFTLRGRTPSDDLTEMANRDGTRFPDLSQLMTLEQSWFSALS